MKKMKRFLSLLICMVMLMSFLPMSASAAINSVTIQLPNNMNDTAANIVNGVRVYYGNSVPHYDRTAYVHDTDVKNEIKTAGGDTITAEIVLRENDQDDNFENSTSVSVRDKEGVTASVSDIRRESYTSYGKTRYQLRFTLTFTKPHVHSYEHVDASSAVHTPTVQKAAMKEHYKCNSCGKLFTRSWGGNGVGFVYDEVQEDELKTSKLLSIWVAHRCRRTFIPLPVRMQAPMKRLFTVP